MKNLKIKIGIVDDDLLFVQLLKNYIDQDDRYEVVMTSTSGHHFLNETNIDLPDVLLLDLRMANGDGIEVMSALPQKEAEVKIIVLSSFYRRSFMGQMLKMGAHAFLSKEIELDELLKVIDAVHHHGHYFSDEQVDVMRGQLSNKLPEFHAYSKDDLTEREIDVLRLVCQQLSTKEIADHLFISPKTVETHKTNLMIKTSVKNMAGLVIYAVQNNFVNAHEIVLLDK
ncbi:MULTISPECIES: response regulator transcription factor [Chryseobacterium]|uniref:response regulator transcription factor n=1 Tax=Chryseobacterium TaxID=59732 RepID=UPI001551FB44|nr:MULTISPECIES: response regulator transcription factor [unclassified Chryseobacterium]MDC8104719.1 response regulator transcription factor [Chryseobacterium sp. B21-037]MDQ1806255.1 response regulator transcription factor [Chryseobacterium sp. CKR4-1]WBV58219.1 response regulator transcription factor [Chryseobacterium daecheongense]